MQQVKIICIALLAALSVGCTSNSNEVQPTHVEGTVEPLLSHKKWDHLLMFVAKTTGCTSHDSFELQIDNVSSKQISVSVIRTQADHCRRAPMFKEYQLTLPTELINADLVVNNPQAPALER